MLFIYFFKKDLYNPHAVYKEDIKKKSAMWQITVKMVGIQIANHHKAVLKGFKDKLLEARDIKTF